MIYPSCWNCEELQCHSNIKNASEALIVIKHAAATDESLHPDTVSETYAKISGVQLQNKSERSQRFMPREKKRKNMAKKIMWVA